MRTSSANTYKRLHSKLRITQQERIIIYLQYISFSYSLSPQKKINEFKIFHYRLTGAPSDGSSPPPNGFGMPGCVVALSNVDPRAVIADILTFFRGFQLK